MTYYERHREKIIAKRKEYIKLHPKPKREKRFLSANCLFCGKEFYYYPFASVGKFCSLNCYFLSIKVKTPRNYEPDIRYNHTPLGKMKNLCRKKTFKLLFRFKVVISEQKCGVIGCCNKAVHSHHWNYGEPMDITFVCQNHHNLIHRGDKETIKNIIRHF